MKKNVFKKSMAFLAVAAMAVGITAAGSAIAKAELINDSDNRSIMGTKVFTDTLEVDAGDQVKVTVEFVDTMAREIPFTLEVTRGAVILVDSEADVEFKTNNLTRAITSAVVNEDGSQMDVMTSAVVKNKKSTFSFYVESPIDAGNFEVILNTDSTNDKFKQITSKPVKIKSGLTVEIPEVLNDVDKFDVTGLATYKGQQPSASSYMFMEMVSVNPDEPYFYEIQLDAEIVNGTYQFKEVKLGSDYEDGEYFVKVYLYDEDLMQVTGYVERQVTFKKKPDVLQVSIYAQQRGVYYTLDDPEEGQGVVYPGLYVYPHIGWYVPNDFHGDHNIQAKAVLKSAKEAREAQNARFVVYTDFDPVAGVSSQVYPAVKSGTTFTGDLRPLRTYQTVTINGVTRKPFVELIYTTADGTEKKVFIGELEPILDPSGHIFDADTEEKIEGAIVTLYRLDEETQDWVEWVDAAEIQVNPQISDVDGKFAWDVENGDYEVRVFHPDYHNEGEYYTTIFDPSYGIISVPPDRTDIYIALKKPVAQPE